MKFRLMEHMSGYDESSFNDMIDFPEITEEMVEDDEHVEILDAWLKEKDLDSFSSWFLFDKEPVQKEFFYLIRKDINTIVHYCMSYCPKCAEEDFNEQFDLLPGDYTIFQPTGVSFEVGE